MYLDFYLHMGNIGVVKNNKTIHDGPAAQNQPEKHQCNVRLATLAVLKQTLIAAYLSPVPCDLTLRKLFDDNRIPRFKQNPSAKRGGGRCFYQVCAVEKLLKSRLLPGNIQAPVAVEGVSA